MSISADVLMDRMKLKAAIYKWRLLSIMLLVLLLFFLFNRDAQQVVGITTGDYIASISIDDMILEDRDRLDVLRDIASSDRVKAVIMHINSPGGTVVGGESLYKAIKHIGQSKPVVSVLGGLATSGGYMVAVASDHIIAHEGTITGSIGVLLQMAEFTDLAKKIGVGFLSYKSSELKGAPSPFEKPTKAVDQSIQSLIDDSYDFFSQLVQKERGFSKEKLALVADGRVVTGRQALSHGLVDEIGNEENAKNWLTEEKNISDDLPIISVRLVHPAENFRAIFSAIVPFFKGSSFHKHSGLMALWNPS